VIPGEFEYFAPTSLKEATEFLRGRVDAKLLAGGMSLIPAMKHRLAQPGAVVDLARIPGLDRIGERRGRVAIGACVVHRELTDAAELVDYPVFAEAAASIGDVQVRNRGTLGGSLAHADPAADWPAVFLALDGEATLVGPAGERQVLAADFFTGILQSAVRPDEILTEVHFSLERKRAGTAYVKLRQQASGFALVGVAAQVVLDRSGRCESAALAITGVNPVPFRAASVEARLRGAALDPDTLARNCAPIEELDPTEDPSASAEYRRHLATVFARRALARAAERAAE
jgi:carbon-monoxide dehydrogenase medium subunit